MDMEKYMKEALDEARKAFDEGEVPIGAVVVKDGEIIGRGHNCRERLQQVYGHAEMVAIKEACDRLGSWKLDGCSLFVTVEPCQMCAGAIMQSRIEHVYYATEDPKAGSMGSVFDISFIQGFDHYPIVHGGLMRSEAEELMKMFFKKMRAQQGK